MKRIIALAIPLFIAACAAILPGCLDTTRDITFTVYVYDKNTSTPIEGATAGVTNTEISDGEEILGYTDSNGFVSATRRIECGAEMRLWAMHLNYKAADAYSIDGDFSCDHPTYTFYLEPE